MVSYAPVPSVASPAAAAQTGVPAPGTPGPANQYARALVALVTLPAGAQVDSTPPLVMQTAPLFGWQVGTGTDLTSAGGTVWRLPLSMAQAVAWFRQHPPAGWQLTDFDATGRISGFTSTDFNTVLLYGRGPVPPPGIWAAQALVSLHADGAAAVFARVDTQVGWYDVRTPGEYIAGYGAMTITGPHGSRTFTGPADIAAVARLLNGLPAAPDDDWVGATTDQYACPARGADYTVAFSVRRGGLPWTKVYLGPADPPAPGPCEVGFGVWSPGDGVNGMDYGYEQQPGLVDPGNVVASYVAGLMR